jgi:hypothetical protein
MRNRCLGAEIGCCLGISICQGQASVSVSFVGIV